MKACNACHAQVNTAADFCPLCGTPLEAALAEAALTSAETSGAPEMRMTVAGNSYPDLSSQRIQYNFIRRLLIFVTLLVCGISVLVNLLVTPGTLWFLIVLAAAVYCWLTIPSMLRWGVNFAKQTVLQVVLVSALVVGIDFFAGYRGWSVSYVVPGLLIAGTVAIGLMAVFNRTNWVQYVIYQVILGVFGFVPLALYLAGIAHNLIMVLVSTGLSLASLLATIVFGDRSIKSEFKRRFHM